MATLWLFFGSGSRLVALPSYRGVPNHQSSVAPDVGVITLFEENVQVGCRPVERVGGDGEALLKAFDFLGIGESGLGDDLIDECLTGTACGHPHMDTFGNGSADGFWYSGTEYFFNLISDS